MRIKPQHSPYIASKISLDLLNSGFVTLDAGLEPVAKVAQDILEADIKKERALEERVNEILQEQEEQVEEMQVDRRDMFRLIKRKLASEFGFISSFEDRFSHVAHLILSELVDEGLVEFNVSDNRVKNIIYASIDGYLKMYQDIEAEVASKIEGYKRKLIPGTQEYELVYDRMYQDEMRKRGLA